MKKMIPLGLLALGASVVLLHGAADASQRQNSNGALGNNSKSAVVAKNATKTLNTNLVTKTGPVLSQAKSPALIDLGKKGTGNVGGAKKGAGLPDVAKKGNISIDFAKKGKSIDKGLSTLVGKNGKSLVKSDLSFHPHHKPHHGNWGGGWWGGWHGHHHHHHHGWHGHHHHHHGGPWWGGCWSWCAPSYDNGGWFSSWCSPVYMQPVIIEAPVGGPVGDPGPVTGPVGNPGPVQGAEQMMPQTVRFLQLKNESGEKLQVFVQYQERGNDGKAVWVPGEPGSDKTVTIDLQVGQELFVETNGKRLASNVIRIWAVSAKGQFLEFRNQDLRLVPEQDQNGEFVYMAAEIKTFTFVFPPLTQTSQAVRGLTMEVSTMRPEGLARL